MRLSRYAPGKLMLGGEYSVLFGGLGLISAVNRYAIASFVEADALSFSTHDGPSSLTHPLFLSVLKACENAGFASLRGGYTIDTHAFFSNHRKLGLGSSAAAITALCKLILAQHAENDESALHHIALCAHDLFSSGLGSGADVTASVLGGLRSFKKIDGCIMSEAYPDHDVCAELLVVDTQRAQNTRPLVLQALQFAQRDPRFVIDFVAQSDASVNELIASPYPHTPMERLFKLLVEFGSRAAIDIVSREHGAIHHIAQQFGGTAKPSGAGGGDLALVLLPSESLAGFASKMHQLNFSLIPDLFDRAPASTTLEKPS